MKSLNYYVMSVCLGLLTLIFLEGILTMGNAFQFNNYGLFAWICQTIGVVFTITLSLQIAITERENK
jgi:hypothetical protein